MRPELFGSKLTLLGALLALSGCPSPATVTPDSGVEVDAGTGTDAGPTLAKSAKGNLRFKGPERLTTDFAAALELAPADVCKELGQYGCSTVVHPLALGGVDPYGKGLYEALPFTGATTPIVVERMALAACGERVTRDLADQGQAVLFKGVLDAQGKVANPNGPEAEAVITALYQRALLRDPEASEVAVLEQLNADIEATGTAEPGKQWLKAACFSVLSSAESVFY